MRSSPDFSSLSSESRSAAPRAATGLSRPTPPPRVAATPRHPKLLRGHHRRPPRPPLRLQPYRELVVGVCANFVALRGTGPLSVINASRKAFLASAMMARTRAILRVRFSWQTARRRQSNKGTLSPTPSTRTGIWILEQRSI
uniref:Uncharacterized protein n=1 Tax=Triticum urartu TaxID=4572 RepID=A0A8R7R8N6_TRIUA